MIDEKYIIKTHRLGLRNWTPSDIVPFIEMSQDPEVMNYFPKLLSEEESKDFIISMQRHFKDFGFCYFAIDILKNEEFIGFTGLLHQTFESDFTPCVDMGWRLKQSAWGMGYATEAAIECLRFAFNILKLNEVYSFATINNIRSEAVMKKIGMNFVGTVQHPMIVGDHRFKHCVVYNIKKIK